ncbi:MAG: tetratricopeptide repeat protein, partial [Gammaproteobacteria bacterium]
MTAPVKAGIAARLCRGRTAVFLFCLLCTSVVNAAWFKNPEQQAAQKFEEGEYSDAASEFSDDYRRGVALYRAGHYTDAGEAFARVEREEVKADALYNLGNTRYKRSDYAGAVDAYTASLELRSGDEDTLHNLALAKKMLEQNLTEEIEQEQEEEE